ncbi:hypothetical protein ONS95_001690 [Cadophora gregata]|uniref:uncharacterized protein n=1 Tax=Cadophora gregata TaxID=51156 RepID=UPI0026DCA214|nr:uncharacterized protein ONS95_001690 [Cadophora gregata]KAK0111325.1 hypothetical protein ONS95_001690 [Cadophora gregata]
MATQRVSPPVPGFVPTLSLNKKEFKLLCRRDARPVLNHGQYGVFSHRLKEKLRITILNYPQGGDHTVTGNVHKFITLHVSDLKLNKVVYLMTATSVIAMVDNAETLAKQLADSFGRTMYIHRGPNDGLRIGELKDYEDFCSIAGYTLVTEAHPHPSLIRSGLYFGDDDGDTDSAGESDHKVADTATPSNVDAYIHLKQTAVVSKAQGKSRRAKRNEIPKPQNAWVLFLNDNYHIVKAENPHMRTTEISKVIAGMWKTAKDTSIGIRYRDLAEQVKTEHAAMYGDYKVKPRKSSEIKRRNPKKTKTAISLQADLSSADMYGLGIDTSEFRNTNFSLGFDHESSGLFAGQEHFTAANPDAQLDTVVNATDFGHADGAASTMNIQASSDFNSGPICSTNMHGGFSFSGPADQLSIANNGHPGYTMAGVNDGVVRNTSLEDALEFSDRLADPTFLDNFTSYPIDLPGQHQFWEFTSNLNNHYSHY